MRSNPKSYLDIGHEGKGAFVWVYSGGRIVALRAATGTHDALWGFKALKKWRGRYEPDTHRTSVVPPEGKPRASVPQYVIDALEARFGGDLEIWQFNPGKKPKRRLG